MFVNDQPVCGEYYARNKNPCHDHLGRGFPSIAAMADAWRVSVKALRSRLYHGWPLEKALTTPSGAGYICHDHLGREFPSQRAMARAWGISETIVEQRIHAGWPLERVLTCPVSPRHYRVIDPENGVISRSAAELALACGVKPRLMQQRLRTGITGGALVFSGDLRKVAARDHTGREFPSLAAMAAAWGQPYSRFESRRNNGWDLERALTAPSSRRGLPKNKEAAHD